MQEVYWEVPARPSPVEEGRKDCAEEVMQFRGYQPNPRMPWRVLEMDHHFKSACLEARSLHLWPLYYQPGGLCQHSREMYRFELGSYPQLRAIPEDGVKRVIFPATVYECLSSEGWMPAWLLLLSFALLYVVNNCNSFLKKMESLWRSAWSNGAIFPTASTDFVSLCHR